MPQIVNKDEIRISIMETFMRLSAERPLTAISLRDIAAAAGMSHSKILRYFESKNALLVSCINWVSQLIIDDVAHWFESHRLKDYSCSQEYLDSFFEYFQAEDKTDLKPRDVVMSCALGAYSPEIKAAVKDAFSRLDELLSFKLSTEFGSAISQEEITAVSVLFSGIYFAKFNESIPSGRICRPVSHMGKLLSR